MPPLAERLKCGLETARSLVTGEVATLKARIESLQAELFKLEATAARHGADYERERDRADLMGAMASLDPLPAPWPMTGRAPTRDLWTFADLCVADKATPNPVRYRRP